MTLWRSHFSSWAKTAELCDAALAFPGDPRVSRRAGDNDGSYQGKKRKDELGIWNLGRRASHGLKSDCWSCYCPLSFVTPTTLADTAAFEAEAPGFSPERPGVAAARRGAGWRAVPRSAPAIWFQSAATCPERGNVSSPTRGAGLPARPAGPGGGEGRDGRPSLARWGLAGFLVRWGLFPTGPAKSRFGFLHWQQRDLEMVAEVRGVKSWQCSIVQSLEKLDFFPSIFLNWNKPQRLEQRFLKFPIKCNWQAPMDQLHQPARSFPLSSPVWAISFGWEFFNKTLCHYKMPVHWHRHFHEKNGFWGLTWKFWANQDSTSQNNLLFRALHPELDRAELGNCIFHITGEFPNTRLL